MDLCQTFKLQSIMIFLALFFLSSASKFLKCPQLFGCHVCASIPWFFFSASSVSFYLEYIVTRDNKSFLMTIKYNDFKYKCSISHPDRYALQRQEAISINHVIEYTENVLFFKWKTSYVPYFQYWLVRNRNLRILSYYKSPLLSLLHIPSRGY